LANENEDSQNAVNKSSVNIDSVDSSIRKNVFQLLEKNHEFSPSNICRLLNLNYKKHGHTVREYKRAWRCQYKNRQALKCLKYHKARGWIYALKSFMRGNHGSLERAVLYQWGWRQTGSRNRMLLFKDPIGRLEWFETGRVNIWINKPASWGKVKKLLALGFFRSGLIKDIEIFDVWAGAARFKGAHLTYDLREHLPYSKIELLKDSLGVVVKTGDVSHPTCVEIEYTYPDWAERNERLLELNKRALEQDSQALAQNSQVIGNFMDQVKYFIQPRGLDPGQDKRMVS
jgi:hypothetical protein